MSSPLQVEPMSHGQPRSPGGHSPVVVASVAVDPSVVSGSIVVDVVAVVLPIVVVAVVVVIDVLAVTDVPIVVVMLPSLPDDPEDVSVSSVSAIIPSGAAQAIGHTTRARQRRFISAR
jgi:hypothetical protein